jgi:hypothetical protein
MGAAVPAEAEARARQLRDYWIARGYLGIQTWVQAERDRYGDMIFGVRSNIVRGFPPRQAQAELPRARGRVA